MLNCLPATRQKISGHHFGVSRGCPGAHQHTVIHRYRSLRLSAPSRESRSNLTQGPGQHFLAQRLTWVTSNGAPVRRKRRARGAPLEGQHYRSPLRALLWAGRRVYPPTACVEFPPRCPR